MSQLDIFSWQNEAYAKAWQQLSEFDVVSCQQTLSELLSSDPEDDEASKILKALEFWRAQLACLDEDEQPERTNTFLENVLSYEFSKDYGPQLLKSKLLLKGIELITKEQRFFVKDRIHLAGLYHLLGDLNAAENCMSQEIERTEHSVELLVELANIQWQMAHFTDARYHYLKGLLLAPEKIKAAEIENPLLSNTVLTHGAEHAAVWAWLYGEQLPLARVSDMVAGNSTEAAKLCKLLLEAERARKEQSSQIATSRKVLHEANAEFYTAYFEYLTKGLRKF